MRFSPEILGLSAEIFETVLDSPKTEFSGLFWTVRD